LVVAGCLTNGQGDSGFYIRNNSAPMGTVCTLTGDQSQPFFAQGIINTASPSGYVFTPLMVSRITAVMGQESQRSISLRGAHITLSGAASAKYDAAFSGTLPPNNGSVNVSFELIPAATLQAVTMRDVIIAEIVPFGRQGSSDINGDLFRYAVTVCSGAGCLIVDHGPCPMMVASPKTGNPCNPFQDLQVDCCREAGNVLSCPGRTM
jgi:hypothetical protein